MSTIVQVDAHGLDITRERIELWKRTYCKGATDDELSLFVNTCERTGLSPEQRQIYAVKRWDGRERREVQQIQVAIDGFRLIADRACNTAGVMRGEEPTQWCGEDGVWREEWLAATPPTAARYTTVKVAPNGQTARFTAVARFAAYCQKTKEGKPMGMWGSMPDVMIAKCAEALCLRKGYPAELSGLYTTDEMAQAATATEAAPTVVQLARTTKPKPGSIEEAAGIVDDVDPFTVAPASDLVSASDAKRELVALCSGDIDAARAIWGLRGSTPVTVDELAELIKQIPADAEIVEEAASV
jgi:phage recombination protein Bet